MPECRIGSVIVTFHIHMKTPPRGRIVWMDDPQHVTAMIESAPPAPFRQVDEDWIQRQQVTRRG